MFNFKDKANETPMAYISIFGEDLLSALAFLEFREKISKTGIEYRMKVGRYIDAFCAGQSQENAAKVRAYFDEENNIRGGDAAEKLVELIEGADSNQSMATMFAVAEYREQFTNSSSDVIRKSVLTLTVAAFESLVQRLMWEYLRSHPRAILTRHAAEEKQQGKVDDLAIPAEVLLDAGSREEAIDYLHNRKVERAMRGPLSSWFDWFNKISGGKIQRRKITDEFAALEEVFERRNCYTHNSGRANGTYASKSKGFANKFNEGEALILTDDYLYESLALTYSIGVKLSVEVSKLTSKESESNADAVRALGSFIGDDLKRAGLHRLSRFPDVFWDSQE